MVEEEISLTGEQSDLSDYVNDEGGIWSLRQVEKIRGWNNIEYGAGLSGKKHPFHWALYEQGIHPTGRDSEGTYPC